MTESHDGWDVFISYASEDRDVVAAPLAQILEHLGLRVWFDRSELEVGDSLRERIDDGLSRSRFGVVILSAAFFGKHWPTRELNGLAQREADGQKVILPVWHELDERGVRQFSPPLADRIAHSWTNGVHAVALDLVGVIRPELAQMLSKRATKIVELKPIESGKDLAGLVAGTHALQLFTDTAQTRDESDRVAAFAQQVQDWGDLWNDLEAGARIDAEFSMHEALLELLDTGWTVHGACTKRKVKFGEVVSGIDVALVGVMKGVPQAVFVDGDQAIVARGTPDAV